ELLQEHFMKYTRLAAGLLLLSAALPALAVETTDKVDLEVPDVFAADASCERQDLRDTVRKRFQGNRVESADIDPLEGRTIATIRSIQVDVFDENNPDE